MFLKKAIKQVLGSFHEWFHDPGGSFARLPLYEQVKSLITTKPDTMV